MKVSDIKKHVMTGISYMIPIIVAGGVLGALAKGFGGYNIGDAIKAGATPFTNLDPYSWVGFWWAVNKISSYAMGFAVAVMTAGTAYSIAGKPAIVPGLVLGYVASESKAGFLGGLLLAFLVGWFVNWQKGWKVPKTISGLMPILVIPVLTSLVIGMLFFMVFARPLAFVMEQFQAWIISLNGGSKALIGAIIGACMGFDLGGPINKTASMAANALGVDGIYGPMSAKIVGGMTPPIGAFIATVLFKKKFNQAEIETGKAALPMGLCFITEGSLPFAAADPAKFIVSSMIGSSVAGAIATGMGVESVAGHGGIFIVPMMVHPLWFIIALIAGSIVTGVIYGFIKSEAPKEEVEEDLEDIDFDIKLG